MNSSGDASPDWFYVHFQYVFEYCVLLFALDMVHPNVFSKPIVSTIAKHVDVK